MKKKKEVWVQDKHYFSIYDMCGDLANPHLCIDNEVLDIRTKHPSATKFSIDFEHDRYQNLTKGVIHFIRLGPAKKRRIPRDIGCSHPECRNKP